MAAGIISYMKTKAVTLALDNATIPGPDYIKVYIDTIKVMSMMIRNPLLVEKQETILRKCLVSKSIEDQVTDLAATKALLPVTDLKPWSDYLFAFANEKALVDRKNFRKADEYEIGYRVIRRVCCRRVEFFIKKQLATVI